MDKWKISELYRPRLDTNAYHHNLHDKCICISKRKMQMQREHKVIENGCENRKNNESRWDGCIAIRKESCEVFDIRAIWDLSHELKRIWFALDCMQHSLTTTIFRIHAKTARKKTASLRYTSTLQFFVALRQSFAFIRSLCFKVGNFVVFCYILNFCIQAQLHSTAVQNPYKHKERKRVRKKFAE